MILFQLYSYNYDDQVKGVVNDPRFEDRLRWNGSNNTNDLQDGSIYILNVTLSDAGTYRCIFNRVLKYSNDYEFHTNITKNVTIIVVPQRKDFFIRFMIALKGSFMFNVKYRMYKDTDGGLCLCERRSSAPGCSAGQRRQSKTGKGQDMEFEQMRLRQFGMTETFPAR